MGDGCGVPRVLLVQGYGLILRRGGRRWGTKEAASPNHCAWIGWMRAAAPEFLGLSAYDL